MASTVDYTNRELMLGGKPPPDAMSKTLRRWTFLQRYVVESLVTNDNLTWDQLNIRQTIPIAPIPYGLWWHGPLSMAHDVWRMVYGGWSMVYGVWSMALWPSGPLAMAYVPLTLWP